MIRQKLAVRYLADETSDCPIPMAPEHFMRKRFAEHDFVHFGDVGVRAYKHANRWQFIEPEVRSAGRTIAARERRHSSITAMTVETRTSGTSTSVIITASVRGLTTASMPASSDDN